MSQPKLETVQVFFKSEVLNDDTCTMESHSATKMNDTWNNWAESSGSYSEWKKPIPKGHISNDSIYRIVLKRQR